MDISIIAGIVLFVIISIVGLYKKRRSQQKHNTTSTNPHFEWVDVPVTKTEWVVTEPAHKEYQGGLIA